MANDKILFKQKAYVTALEKSMTGGVLSAADIAELLKDPNSWISKLYASLKMTQVMIAEFVFIRYLLAEIKLYQEERRQEKYFRYEYQLDLELKQRDLVAANTAVPGALSQQQINMAKGDKDTLITALKLDLVVLLSQDQTQMKQGELEIHHQQMMNNVNQQVLINLGPTVEFSDDNNQIITLPIPTIPRPTPPLSKILAKNHELRDELRKDKKIQEGFAQYHAKAETGFLGVFSSIQHILSSLDDHIVKAFDNLSITHRKHLFKKLDDAYKEHMENSHLTGALQFNHSKVIENYLKVHAPMHTPQGRLSK